MNNPSNKRKTTAQFIKEALKVFPDFDYSKVNYKNSGTKVIVVCKKHGEFKTRPADFLRGHGCPYCGIESRANKRRSTKQEFVKKALKIWPSYNYDNIKYKNNHAKVEIICQQHGSFYITPANLLSGHGCPHCVGKAKKTTEIFIAQAKKLHPDYIYDKVNYTNNSAKIEIICKKHGPFFIAPVELLRGKGCNKCASSKLELITKKVLKEINIKYECQKKFDKCKNIKLLPFDFFIPELNILIECQGIQHYSENTFYSKDGQYEIIKKRDMIKKEFCKKEGYLLLEIPYWKNTEEQISRLILAEQRQLLQGKK